MSTGSPHRSPLLASFQASYGDLVRYLSRRTGCPEAARDAVHDTWLRIADMAEQGAGPALQGEGEARAYLFTMARNVVIDQQRRDGVAHRHAAREEAAGCGLTGSAATEPDAAESAMYRQAIAAVEAALNAVPDRARQVFLRNRVHGEDQAALAAEFGVSRNMIERDMMLAMDHVQAAMERWRAGSAEADASASAAATRAPAVRHGRRRSLAALLGAGGMLVLGAGSWRWWRWAVPQWQQSLATAHGTTLRQPLPDGSVVMLDAQSRVEVAYYGARRSARLLAGAAFFDVSHDASRPFSVEVPTNPVGADSAAAPGLRITVLGTRFGVDRLPGGGVEVQVDSGRVRVEWQDGADGVAGAAQTLLAGQRWQGQPPASSGGQGGFGAGAPGALLAPLPVGAASWRHGTVAFDDVPLGDAVERLRRYLPRPVQVQPEAAALRVSGQVRIAQAEDFVRTLPAVVPVQARLADGRWQLAAIQAK